jgi:hypothetical protein
MIDYCAAKAAIPSVENGKLPGRDRALPFLENH